MSDEAWMQFSGFRQLAKWLVETSRGSRFLTWFAKHYFRRLLATEAGYEFEEYVRTRVEQESEFKNKRQCVVIETHPDGFIRVYGEAISVTFVHRISTYPTCEAMDEERCWLSLSEKQRAVYLDERKALALEHIKLHPTTIHELLEQRTRGELFRGLVRDKQPTS